MAVKRDGSKQRRRRLWEQLEERVLFDAVVDMDLVDGIDSIDEHISQSITRADALEDESARVDAASSRLSENPKEVVFIDTAVEELDALLSGLLEQNRELEIVFLDPTRDGLVQIAEQLDGHTGVNAIHLLSHGSDGQIQLGASVVTSESLSQYTASLAKLGQSLSESADILIYGCDLASTDAGRAFAETFAALTGADVAASEDRTGHAELGGDWELEFTAGEIETEIVVASALQASYHQHLELLDINAVVVSDGTPSFDPNNDPGNDDGSLNGIVRAHDIVTIDLFYNTDSNGATNPYFEVTLPHGMVFDNLPAVAALDSRSGIFDSDGVTLGGDMRHMKMYIPDVNGTISSNVTVVARALGVANGTTVNDIKFYGTSDQNSTLLETPEDIDFTISSAARMDILLEGATFRGAYTDATGSVDGVVYSYTIGILGDHPTRSGSDAVKGAAPLEDPFKFDVDLTNVSAGAQVFTWGDSVGAPDAQDGITRNYEYDSTDGNAWSRSNVPSGRTGDHNSASWNAERSTPDSGDWNITSSSLGVFSVEVTGADTSGSSFPSQTGSGATLPADEKWFAVGQVHVWIPIADVRPGNDGVLGNDDDGLLTIAPEITNFDPFDAFGITNNFGTGFEDTSNNAHSHDVITTGLGGPGKRNSQFGAWTWVDTATYWNAGDGVTSVGHQYDSFVTSGQNTGVLPIDGLLFGDKFDNTSTKIAPISDYSAGSGINRSNHAWSRAYLSGGGASEWLQEGIDYEIEFASGGVDGDPAGWTDWDSMGDATLADDQAFNAWTSDPTDISTLGGTADPDTGVSDAITKYRVRLLNPLRPGGQIYAWVSLETTGHSTLDPANNPDGDIIANFVAGTASYLQSDADPDNDWRTSEYDPATNKWYAGGSSGHVWRGDRLTLVEAAVRVDKTVVDIGSGNLFLAGSAATIQLDATVTIPGPDSGAPAQDVWVTDILPSGLSVVNGSASLSVGDAYTAGDGSTQTVQAVEYFDGSTWSSTWTYGASGIRFGFGDVPLNTSLPAIQFDVLIPYDAKSGETWENTAVISSPSDTAPEEWRDSQAGLVAVQVAAMSVGKDVITPVIPEDGTISFSMGVANISDDKVIPWFDAVDVLPFDGDTNGSSFCGGFTNISLTGLDPYIDVFVTDVSGSLLDSQDGVVDGYGDPGTDGTHSWYVAPGTGIWQYTLDDVIAGTTGAPTMDSITALRFVSDGSINPHLPAGTSTNWQLHLETDGNVGIPSDEYTNRMVARTDESVLPLPVLSPPSTAKVIHPQIEIEKETCLDETGVNCDPTVDSHWGEMATFDDTNETTFRIKVTNTGTSDVDATVTDILPAGLTYVAGSASASAGDISGFPTTWTTSLAVGQSAYLVFSATTTDAGSYNNTADVDVVDQFGQTASDSDDSSVTFASEVSVTKHQTGVVRSTSNPDEFHVSYEVELMNTSQYDLYDLTLSEDLFGAFGTAHTGIRTAPMFSGSSVSTGGSLPVINSAFDGNLNGVGDAEVFDGTSGLLLAGDSVTVTYTVIVDISKLSDPGNTFNQVVARGNSGGGSVSDLSDDGDDPTSQNATHPGDTGGADDPTPLRIPLIELEKEVSGTEPAQSGTNGNFDVTYQFTIENVGTTDLNNIALTEDLFANLGGAFVGVVQGPRLVSSTATDAPDFNKNYDGGLSDANVFVISPVSHTFDFSGSNSKTTIGKSSYVSTDRFGIDPNQVYTLSVDAFAGDGSGGNFDTDSVHYLGIASYDVDGRLIREFHHMRFPGATDTTLAAPLNPGDTTITLTDATGWNNAGVAHQRSILLYDYTDGTGYTHPDYTYSRDIIRNDAWSPGGISGNVITFNAPYAGPAKDAGTAVRNVRSGGAYQYTLASYDHIDESGTTLSSSFGAPVNDSGNYSYTQFRPGTDTVAALVLADYTTTGTQLNISDFVIEAPNESLLEVGQSYTFEIVVEVDPDAPGARLDSVSGDSNGDLENQANVTANEWHDGTPVSDNSDDPTDPTNADNEGDLDADDPTGLFLPNIQLTKTQVGSPIEASSGTVGNFDVTYDLTFTNTGNDDLVNLSLVEDLATQYGGAFVSIVSQSGAPATVLSSSATDTPEINSSYDGKTVTDLIDNVAGTNRIETGQSVTVRIVIEVDPDSPTAIYNDYQLRNQATISGVGVGSGSTVTDDSDDPTNTANSDNDADNDPDDPNLLMFPKVAIAKSIVGAPLQLANGNWTVQYQLVVENIGTTYLSNLQVVEDLAAEFGSGVFKGVVAAPVISVNPTDASSTAPLRNINYNGLTDTNLLDGTSGLLAPNDFYTIGVTVEIDPNDASAVLPMHNTATTSGDASTDDGTLITKGGSTITVTDDSDSGTNPESTNSGADGDTGGTDDPTPLNIADLDITKAIIGTPTALPNGNFEISYSVLVANTGTVDLANLSLLEDVQSQFGSGFVSAGDLRITTAPTDSSSSVSLDSSGWNGNSTASEMVDTATPSLLATGDSFVLEFSVEVDATALPTNTTPTIYTDEATFVAATGATLREDFSDVVGNTSVSLPFISSGGVQISGSVTSSVGTGTETRQSATSFDGQAPDDGVFAIRQLDGGTANLRITVPNPGHAIGLGIADVFDPAGGNPAGKFTHFKVTASDGTILFEFDERTDGDLPANDYRFLGIQGTGSQNYTHIDIEYETNGNDNWTIDHIYDLGNYDNTIENQILANADAVDENGNPIRDSSGNPLEANDKSDSGATADSSNHDQPGDTGSHNDPTPLLIPNISLTKSRFGSPVPASSGIVGNFDVTYDLTVTSTGNEPINTLSLVEDLATQYGGAFKRIVPQSGLPTTIVSSNATDTPELNASYDGGTLDSQIFDNSGGNSNLLLPKEFVTVRIVIEIDPDAPGAIFTDGNLVNQASVQGVGQTTGGTVSDLSDDPNNGANVDGNPNTTADDDGNPDDPNRLRIPNITIQKAVLGTPTAASSGKVGNWDVTYQFTVDNTGTTSLDALNLVDDWNSRFGSAFVRILPGSVSVSNVNASSVPGANSSYAGGGTENMLDGTGSFDPGQRFNVSVTVEVDPNATGAILVDENLVNQATITGTDSATNNQVTDLSDDPTDATDTDPNGDRNPDDPTRVSFSDIGLAKRIVRSDTSSTPGNLLLTYEFVMRNIGSTELEDLQLQDFVAGSLGPGFAGVTSKPIITSSSATSDPTLNSSYNGNSVVNFFDGTSGLLKPSEQITIRLQIEVDLDHLTTTSNNQGTATGSDGSTTVSDLSDTGSNPESNNPGQTGDSGGEDDPTLPPAIGIAKNHGDPTPAGIGNQDWNVPVSLVVRNLGMTSLTSLSLIEDIASEFGTAFVRVDTPVITPIGSVSGTLPTVNANWETDTSLNILDGTGTLEPGDGFTITFNVLVDPDASGSSTTLDNQSTISANDPDNPDLAVTDLSDSGTNPTSRNLGEPGDSGGSEDPTPLQIPDLGVGKRITNVQISGLQALMTIEIVLENTGTVDLVDLTLQEDLASQYGGNFVGIISQPVITNSTATVDPTINAGFDGDRNADIFDAASGHMKPGEQVTVEVLVSVQALPGEGTVVLENQAIGGGSPVDDSGNPIRDDSGNPIGTVTDDSDSGNDPNADNPGQPGDTGGWDDPTLTSIQFFSFDGFNNLSDPFGQVDDERPGGRYLTQEIHSLAPDPMFSGSARPGTKIVGRLYDQNGFQIGYEEVFADVGGNWMMQVHELDQSRGTGYARVEFVEVAGIGQAFTPNGDPFGYLGQDKMDNDYAALEPWTPYDEHYDFIAIYRGGAKVSLAMLHKKANQSIGFGSEI